MVKLPDASEVHELNRVLIAVAQLSSGSDACSMDAALALCASVAFSGRPADHRRTVRVCAHAGLIIASRGMLALTESGREFLRLNPLWSYELAPGQKEFVARRLILDGPWRSRGRDVLLHFRPNYSRLTYEFDPKDKALPRRCKAAEHLLRMLGVLQEVDGTLAVAPDYVAPVAQLLAGRRGITEEELGRALQAKRTLGARAEEAVLEYERRRLQGVGQEAAASLVRLISHLDVAAGYDIESFDGDKPLFEYDRFIEVKASQRRRLRFYWTGNERAVAQQLGPKYWIYFVAGLRATEAEELAPIMIQDPATRLGQMAEVVIDVSTYIVRQRDGLNLEPIPHQAVKGFTL